MLKINNMKYPYFILLILLLTVSCSKSERLKAKHTARLDKSFLWQISVFSSSYALGDTTYSYPDTVLPITVVDDETLNFRGDTFTYTDKMNLYLGDDRDVDLKNVMHFVDFSKTQGNSAAYIDFYYKKDEVKITYIHGGRGGSNKATYTSKL